MNCYLEFFRDEDSNEPARKWMQSLPNQRRALSPTAKTIFWDFDGTLAYRPGMWSSALADVLAESEASNGARADDIRPLLMGSFPWHTPDVPHLELNTAGLWWNSLERVLARAYVGVGLSQEVAERLAFRAHERYVDPKGWFLYDDVLSTLTELAARGWRHIVVSNHVPELATIVDGLGLMHLVEQVVTSARVGYEKPHEEMFRAALRLAGNPEEAWMVGDNVVADVLGAESAGIRAVLVRSCHPRAARSCADLRGVAAILDSI